MDKRPSDIPSDVWDTASAVYARIMAVEWYDIGVISRAILAERERCAKVCEEQKNGFLSPEYASNQPLGSLTERFACDECATAIRSVK